MSTTIEVTVWCDEPECHAWTFGGGNTANNHTATGARKGAKAEGWTRRDGADYCPTHSRRQRARRPQTASLT